MKTCKTAGIADIAKEHIQDSSTELWDKLFKLVNKKFKLNIYIHYGKDPKRFQETF